MPEETRALAPPEPYLPPDKRWKLRRFLVAAGFVVAYVLLDRSTISFQIWTEISAWYPPTGLALAALIGFGWEYAPLILLGEYISSILNYHQPIHSYIFLVGNIEFVAVYAAAAEVLRRVLKIDTHLRSVRDVIWLLLIPNCAACIEAFLGAWFLTADRLIPPHQYLRATMN
jgi:integral membrane sensor domain MASE1